MAKGSTAAPTAAAASNKTGIIFTPRDIEILVSAIAKCTKDPISIDYPKLANLVGLSGSASAKSSWHGLKKKLDKGAEAMIAAATNADAEAIAEDAEEIAELAAEVKKGGKGQPAKRKAAETKGEDDEGDAEELEVAKSPVKTRRQRIAQGKGKILMEATETVEGIKVEEDEVDPEPVKKAPAKKGRVAAKKKGKATVEDEDGVAVKAEGDAEPEVEEKVPVKKGRPARAKKPTVKAAEAEKAEVKAEDADE